MGDADGTDYLKTGTKEFIKTYVVEDVSGRAEYVYEARTGAGDGDPCLVTRYGYNGTTARIQKTKEYEAEWDSSWDF